MAISDNGPGIAATATERKPGMGSEILKGLVSQVRGTLVVQSDGCGTTHILTMPIEAKVSSR